MVQEARARHQERIDKRNKHISTPGQKEQNSAGSDGLQYTPNNFKKLQKALKSATDISLSYKIQFGEANKTIRHLEREKKRLDKENDEHTTEIGQLRKTSVAVAHDEKVVLTEIKAVVDEWKIWARKWSLKPGDFRSLCEEDRSRLFRSLNAQPKIMEPGAEQHLITEDNAAFVLLEAVISHLIINQILMRPFFFLENCTDKQCSVDLEAATTALLAYGDMGQYHSLTLTIHADVHDIDDVKSKAAVAQTTAQIVNLFRIDSDSKNDGRVKKQRELMTMKERFYSQLLRDLENSPKASLLREVTDVLVEKRRSSLREMFSKAEQLAVFLWSQGTAMAANGFRHMTSQLTERHAELHSTMCCGVDGAKFDRRALEVVVRPRLRAFGNDRGKQFSGARVWIKPKLWYATDELKTRTEQQLIVGGHVKDVTTQRGAEHPISSSKHRSDSEDRLTRRQDPSLTAQNDRMKAGEAVIKEALEIQHKADLAVKIECMVSAERSRGYPNAADEDTAATSAPQALKTCDIDDADAVEKGEHGAEPQILVNGDRKRPFDAVSTTDEAHSAKKVKPVEQVSQSNKVLPEVLSDDSALESYSQDAQKEKTVPAAPRATREAIVAEVTNATPATTNGESSTGRYATDQELLGDSAGLSSRDLEAVFANQTSSSKVQSQKRSAKKDTTGVRSAPTAGIEHPAIQSMILLQSPSASFLDSLQTYDDD